MYKLLAYIAIVAIVHASPLNKREAKVSPVRLTPNKPHSLYSNSVCCVGQTSLKNDISEDQLMQCGDLAVEGMQPSDIEIFACDFECLGNFTNMYNPDRSINKEKFMQRMISDMGWDDKEFSEGNTPEDAWNECQEVVSEDAGAHNTQCDLKFPGMLFCVWRRMLYSCPASKQQNSSNCLRIRQRSP